MDQMQKETPTPQPTGWRLQLWARPFAEMETVEDQCWWRLMNHYLDQDRRRSCHLGAASAT